MKLTEAYVVNAKGGEFALETIELSPLESSQVEIGITHCGLCHTDIHMKNDTWNIANFPLVAGHEGLGIVTAIGSRVIGDVVGVGWIRDSCGTCTQCQRGHDNICKTGYQGTFLSHKAGVWGTVRVH
jgi:uncharacterized zinc-type alcohol dehydrogenase-like protein